VCKPAKQRLAMTSLGSHTQIWLMASPRTHRVCNPLGGGVTEHYPKAVLPNSIQRLGHEPSHKGHHWRDKRFVLVIAVVLTLWIVLSTLRGLLSPKALFYNTEAHGVELTIGTSQLGLFLTLHSRCVPRTSGCNGNGSLRRAAQHHDAAAGALALSQQAVAECWGMAWNCGQLSSYILDRIIEEPKASGLRAEDHLYLLPMFFVASWRALQLVLDLNCGAVWFSLLAWQT